MAYVLTIYFVLAFEALALQGPIPNLEACKTEAANAILKLHKPPYVIVHAECTSTVINVKV